MCRGDMRWEHCLTAALHWHRLSVRHKQKKRTRVVWNKKNPDFEEDFHFLIHFPEHQELSVQLTDHNLGDNSLLGRCAC